LFWGKARKIEELVLRHLRQVDESLAAFHCAVIAYVVDGDLERAKEMARKLQLRDFVRQLVEISDRAEDLSDRLDILVRERVL
jgi:uncharacterized protein Yka (UPF0111/DUF47 family)